MIVPPRPSRRHKHRIMVTATDDLHRMFDVRDVGGTWLFSSYSAIAWQADPTLPNFSAVSALRNALTAADDVVAFKTWELGAAAALYLRATALAAFDRTSGSPAKLTLSRVLGCSRTSPGDVLYFPSRSPGAAQSLDDIVVDPSATFVSWAADMKAVGQAREAFVISGNDNEQAIEGCSAAFAYSDIGRTRQLPLVLQNKRRGTLRPQYVAETCAAMTRVPLGGVVGHRINLLFVTGESQRLQGDLLKRFPNEVQGSVIVTTEGCRTLFEPFGSSVLVAKIMTRSRQSQNK